MRTDGLKSAENTKLINLLEGFKGNNSTNPEPIPDAPIADTRTRQEIESEKFWREFVAEDEEEHCDLDLSGASVTRKIPTMKSFKAIYLF